MTTFNLRVPVNLVDVEVIDDVLRVRDDVLGCTWRVLGASGSPCVLGPDCHYV